MVRKSRFLRQGSTPPNSSDQYSAMSCGRSYRANSAAPSINYRASSIAPMRAGSVAPLRASSVAPMRASSVAPYPRSTVRASSVSPYSSAYGSSITSSFDGSRGLRASSLAPQSLSSFRSITLNPNTNDSYRVDTAIPSRQFGTRLGIHKMETSVKPAIYDEYYGMTYVPSSGRDSWSAYRISDETLDDNDDLVYQSAKKDHEVMKKVNQQIHKVEAMNVQPPVYVPVAPVYRHFASQQAPMIIHVGKEPKLNNTVPYRRGQRIVPAVHREPSPAPVNASYSTTYSRPDPSPVNVSYNTAYRRPDPAPVSVSYNTAYRRPDPAPVSVSYNTAYRRPDLAPASVSYNTAYRRPDPAPVKVSYSTAYTRPDPAPVKVSYNTGYRGSELLHPKQKAIANETVDFERPATYRNLKERLREASDIMARSKASVPKHSSDPDLQAIDAEVNAIRNARSMREQSLNRLQ